MGPRGAKGEQGCPGPAGPRGSAGPMGPRGPQGVRGDTGPKGDQGLIGLQGVRGDPGPIGPKGDRGPVGPKGDVGPMGPMGPKGERGEKGERGPAGEQGPVGEQGVQGEVGPQGVQGDTGCPGPQGEQGIRGIQGEKGEQGEQGLQGIQGDKGETGENGETPVMTVAENTPISYKVNFKTADQNVTTPNLFANYTDYHANIAATGNALNVPVKNLVLTYQTVSSGALRISIAPKDTAVPILADIRRSTIFNTGSVEAQTFDNNTVSERIVLDDTVYSRSQETHTIKIRQQDPSTKLWSLCEVSSFISNGGARTSVVIRWSEYDVSYEAPTS